MGNIAHAVHSPPTREALRKTLNLFEINPPHYTSVALLEGAEVGAGPEEKGVGVASFGEPGEPAEVAAGLTG